MNASRLGPLLLARLLGLLLTVPLAVSAMPACLAPEHGGIGGTGLLASLVEGGIGGTGVQAEGGIGGTGVRAEGGIGGTGIVGTITGFASICVNGLEVHYDATTPVSRNGLPAGLDQLAVGQVVSIEALPGKRGLEAGRIAILHAMEGLVSHLYPKMQLFYVLGQPVQVGIETRFDGIESYAEVTRGLPVRVSGYRDATGTLIASRVEVVAEPEGVSVMGALTLGPAGQPSVAGLPVLLAGAPPAEGTELLVRGRWDGQRVVAEQILRDPSLPFAGHVGQIVAEGLVLARDGARQLRIGGYSVEMSAHTAVSGGAIEQATPGQRLRISGRLVPGRKVQAARVELIRGMGLDSRPGHGENPHRGARPPADASTWITPGGVSGSGSAMQGPGGFGAGGGAAAGATNGQGAGQGAAQPGRGGPVSGSAGGMRRGK